MENDLLGLHFPVSYVHFVPYQHHGDLVAHSHQVLVPLWYVFVSDPGSHVEHDHSALASNIVSVSQAAQLLLACSVSDVEFYGSPGSVEYERSDFDS